MKRLKKGYKSVFVSRKSGLSLVIFAEIKIFGDFFKLLLC